MTGKIWIGTLFKYYYQGDVSASEQLNRYIINCPPIANISDNYFRLKS